MRSIRIWFNKKDTAKYISHLDLTRCMIRAFRRTDIPLWYTEGFNPRPHLVFGLSLPLGVEGLRETLDIRLNDDDYPNQMVLDNLNNVMVSGIDFLEIQEPQNKPLAITQGAYRVEIPADENKEKLLKKINSAIENEVITYEKKTKKGGFKTINVTENLKDFNSKLTDSGVLLSFILPAGNDFTVNPVSFCDKLFDLIGEKNILHRIIRLKLLMADGEEFK